jgi:hypothetical protein
MVSEKEHKMNLKMYKHIFISEPMARVVADTENSRPDMACSIHSKL